MPKQRAVELTEATYSKQARAPRTPVRLRVRGTDERGTPVELEVLNLSATGMLFRHAGDHDRWTTVDVLLPSGRSAKGEISWADGDLVGLKFIAPISAADIAAVSLKGEFLDAPADVSNPTVPAPDFLANLAETRISAGLTLEDLAGKLGVSRQAVWYWEKGRSTPRPAALQALRRLLGDSAGGPRGNAEGLSWSFSAHVDQFKADLADRLGLTADAIRVVVEK
ncbi:helix-turn-helix transcriptional regulator [Tsuneonella sp. HG222]